MAHDALKLLEEVREVAALADPAEPTAVTQRAFDAARERSPAHASVPRARQVTEQLGLTWADVLAIAHAPRAKQTKLLAMKAKQPSSANWLTEAHSIAVLQIVAQRLGAKKQGKKKLTKAQYKAERAKLLAESAARPTQGQLPLPTAAQVMRVCGGSWEDALHRAKLGRKPKPRPKPKPPPPPPPPDYDAWNPDSCVAAVARYFAQLPKWARPGAKPRDYTAWAATQDHAPEMTVIRHHCKTWREVRRAALDQLGLGRAQNTFE